MVFKRVRSLIFGAVVPALLVIAGCATPGSRVEPICISNETSPPPAEPHCIASAPSEGSLWSETGEMLFVDTKARKLGDTVTVDIVENTSSSMDVNTKTSRQSSIDAGISHALGYMQALEAKNRYLDINKLFEANYDTDFDGKGTSDRSGQVTASIGARVVEVLPNGNLAIYGTREMKVNNEVQFITVSGIARPIDIGPDNRVKSVFLADSRIVYSGRGVLADKQKPGWMTRVLDNVWPF
jgi:flagellar L-ring protein precursor FlgH